MPPEPIILGDFTLLDGYRDVYIRAVCSLVVVPCLAVVVSCLFEQLP